MRLFDVQLQLVILSEIFSATVAPDRFHSFLEALCQVYVQAYDCTYLSFFTTESLSCGRTKQFLRESQRKNNVFLGTYRYLRTQGRKKGQCSIVLVCGRVRTNILTDTLILGVKLHNSTFCSCHHITLFPANSFILSPVTLLQKKGGAKCKQKELFLAVEQPLAGPKLSLQFSSPCKNDVDYLSLGQLQSTACIVMFNLKRVAGGR